MIENLTYEQLAGIQNLGFAIAGGILIITAIYFVLGMFSPGRFGARGRLSILGRSLGMIILAFSLAAGVVFFTHSHENGSHAFKGYLDDFIRHECQDGRDLPACKDAKYQTPPISVRTKNY